MLLLSAALAAPAAAQPNRIVPVEDWTYTYLHRLQRRGLLLELHPTALPYTRGEVIAALREVDANRLAPAERVWLALLVDEFRVHKEVDNRGSGGIQFDTGVRVADSRRLDLLRPLDRGVRGYSEVGLDLYLDSGPIVANVGLRHDLYNVWDPDALDSGTRLYARNENAYVGYNRPNVSVYLGRYSTHWAPPGDPAAVLSSNPKTYDKIAFRFGGRMFSVRGLFGELDSIELDLSYTGRAGDRSSGTDAYGERFGSLRRFVTAHRLDYRPTRWINIAYLQSVVISSDNTGFSLKWLNPVTNAIFATDNQPKNDENNALIAGLLWLYLGRVTVHGQLMLDDIDLADRMEPAALALMGSIRYAHGARADLGLEAEVVSSRSYKSEQVEGHYLYLLRGLAAQYADYIRISGSADLYLDDRIPGLSVTPRLSVLLAGEQGLINRPYPDDQTPFILAGTESATVRAAIAASYQPNRYFWLGLDAGVNHVRRSDHGAGVRETRPAFVFRAGARFPYTYRRRDPL